MKKTVLFLFSLNLACFLYTESANATPYHKFVETGSIDVSKDLIDLGISNKNLSPNDKSTDAGPLIEAAVQYAVSHKISKIIFPSGDYYFNSVRNGAHLYINNINNIALLGKPANFIFGSRKAKGVLLNNCNKTGLENISLDYAGDLPFTSAIVGSVDPTTKAISFSSVTGRPLSELENKGKSSVKIFILRKSGNTLKSITTRMTPVPGDLNNNSITVQEKDLTNLQKIKVGDIVSISERSYAGNNALNFVTYPPNLNEGNFAKNVTVYSSPAVGIAALWQKNLTYSDVRVQAKQGREQYISTNADGVNIGNGGAGNKIINSYITLSGDDGISFSTGIVGTVINSDNKSVTATLRYNLKQGQSITFADPADLHEYGSSSIEQITTLTKGPLPSGQFKQYSFSLDTAIDGIKPGAHIFLAVTDRADGTLIQNDTIVQTFSRGIYFAGVTGTRIQSNVIKETTSCAIYGQRSNEGGDGGFKSPENTNTTIVNNQIVNAFAWGYAGQRGAIEFSITNGGQDASSVNNQVTIKDNDVSFAVDNGAHHVGIYIANTKNFSLSNNKLLGRKGDGSVVNLSADRKMMSGPKAIAADVAQ